MPPPSPPRRRPSPGLAGRSSRHVAASSPPVAWAWACGPLWPPCGRCRRLVAARSFHGIASHCSAWHRFAWLGCCIDLR
eukprot:7680800-Pyramimonas_sp.AAC.1